METFKISYPLIVLDHIQGCLQQGAILLHIFCLVEQLVSGSVVPLGMLTFLLISLKRRPFPASSMEDCWCRQGGRQVALSHRKLTQHLSYSPASAHPDYHPRYEKYSWFYKGIKNLDLCHPSKKQLLTFSELHIYVLTTFSFYFACDEQASLN